MRRILALVVLASTPLAASGQGFVVTSDQRAEADAYYRLGGSITGNLGLTQDFSGVNFYAIEDRSFSFNGFSGRGYAEHGATFTPANPGIGGGFTSVVMDACTSAEIFTAATTNDEDRAYGIAHGEIVFDVQTAQNWTWVGFWQGFTFNSGAYYEVSGEISLIDVNSGTPIVQDIRQSANGVGDWADPINYAGVLGPGTYQLTWSHQSIVANGSTPWGFFGVSTGGSPLVSCINSTFSLSPIPAPGAVALFGVAAACALRRRR